MTDWGINLGNILTMIVPVAGMIGAAFVMRERVEVYIKKVDALEQKLGQLVNILLAQERFEGKLSTMDERLSSQGRRLDGNIEKFDRHIEQHSLQPTCKVR